MARQGIRPRSLVERAYAARARRDLGFEMGWPFPLQPAGGGIIGAILTESGEPILTESGEAIVTEDGS